MHANRLTSRFTSRRVRTAAAVTVAARIGTACLAAAAASNSSDTTSSSTRATIEIPENDRDLAPPTSTVDDTDIATPIPDTSVAEAYEAASVVPPHRRCR